MNMPVNLYKMMQNNRFRLALCLSGLLALSCPDALNAQKREPEWVYRVPEETVKGIRYFKHTNLIYQFHEYPTLPDLRYLGFIVNPEDEETYIAPDGRVVPKFFSGLCVVAPNSSNGYDTPPDGTPTSYSGEIYLPDFIEGFLADEDEFVLDFYPSAMGENLTSMRTPLYITLGASDFTKAVNLQKVQIGACYAVLPETFLSCKSLETLIFERAPFVYDLAFAGCAGIKAVVLQSEDDLPLLEGTKVFEGRVYEQATLYVPDNLMDACKADPAWGRFANVKSLKECNIELVKR